MKEISVVIVAIGLSGIICMILDTEYGVHPAMLWGIGTLIGFGVGLFVEERS